MTKIGLIRHGQTDWNKHQKIQGRIDNSLNDTGRTQAQEIGLYLKNHDPHWDVIMASPLLRTVQTAKIIATILGYHQPIIINPAVIERDFGAADGLLITPEVYDKIIKDDYDKMETTAVLQKRTRQALLDLENLYPNQKILIVTHSHFIKGLFTTFNIGITFTSYLANGSISYVDVENGNFLNPIFNHKT